jgi:phage terminase large subunit-like protein
VISLRPAQFVDPSLKSDKDPEVKYNPDGTVKADWFALATAARVRQLVYLLDLYRAQIPFPEQVRVLKREHALWHSYKIGIENHAYQWALGQAVWDQGLPVVPVTYPGDKVMKAQLATPHFESGRVRIRGVKDASGMLVPHPALKKFVQEAIDFPFGGTDDCVDAVVGVVLMCTGPEFVNQEFAGGVNRGFSIIIGGGTGKRHRFDPFDQWNRPSSF